MQACLCRVSDTSLALSYRSAAMASRFLHQSFGLKPPVFLMEDHVNTININSSRLLSQIVFLVFFTYAVKLQNSTHDVETIRCCHLM